MQTSADFETSADNTEAIRTFSFHSRSLAKLAQATSSGIAWLLIMPDAFALLPNSDDAIAYFLKLLGLWVSAAVLWFVSFLAILNLVRLTVAEVSVSSAGIKLWRFAKIIPWENIQAIEIAPQMVFSKFFSLSEVARRMTLFEARKKGPKILRGRLITHNIPSFLFATKDFNSLAVAIIQHKFGLDCSLNNVLLFEPQMVPKLKGIDKAAGLQRLIITALITFGLVTVLGRKAIVNYSYNYGNKCLAENNLLEAKERYETALAFEPGFSAALNNLALAEYRNGEIDRATRHWKRALIYKPDYVEAKISLAHLSLKSRQFEQANSYIERALNIAPLNAYATLRRAEYNLLLGRNQLAVRDARAVTTQGPSTQVASAALCLLAQAKLRTGDVAGAQKSLLQLAKIPTPTDSEFQSNFALVRSQVALAASDISSAEKFAQIAVRLNPLDGECSQNLVHILVLEDKIDAASALAYQAVAKSANSPFAYLAVIEVLVAKNDFTEATQQLLIAEKLPEEDAHTSSMLASEALQLGRKEEAARLFERALKIDFNAADAKKLKDLHLTDAKLFSSQDRRKPE